MSNVSGFHYLLGNIIVLTIVYKLICWRREERVHKLNMQLNDGLNKTISNLKHRQGVYVDTYDSHRDMPIEFRPITREEFKKMYPDGGTESNV